MKRLYAAAIVALLVASPAWAIDFTQPLKNIDGSTPKTDKEGLAPTLGSICVSALISQYKDEVDQSGKETVTPQEKFHRGHLADKIANAKDQKDLTLPPEDLAMLKTLIGKAYGPLIVSQAWPMLDPSLRDEK